MIKTIPSAARGLRFSATAVACLVLWGCASRTEPAEGFWDRVTPYKLEVVQGNVVTREQAALVKPGMARAEVRDVLGSPLLTDVFHANRWDYVFTIRRQGAAAQQRTVTVRFDGDRVAKFEAQDLPSETDFVTSIATAKTGSVPKLELTAAEIQALPLPVAPPPAVTAPVGAARTYPPLEAKK